MAEKTYFKLNHRIINCIFLWPHILTYFIALNVNNILKYPGRSTKYMSCIIYDTQGTRGLTGPLVQENKWKEKSFKMAAMTAILDFLSKQFKLF